MKRFPNRSAAGRDLATRLTHLSGTDLVVLGLPRGGVPVALEIAEALHAPLDVIVVRKVGVPSQPELAMGAIGEDGIRVVNHDIVAMAGVTADAFERVEANERREMERRATRFRAGRLRQSLEGKTAIVVDDGIATGSTARAACQVARAHGAARVVLAVPVAAPDSLAALGDVADEIVCVQAPRWLRSVGEWYDDFTQVSDATVVELLTRARAQRSNVGEVGRNALPAIDEEVAIAAGTVILPGHLVAPADASGLVIFAHGSGSSRHSPRNRWVADQLNLAGLATLTFDLLTDTEAEHRRNVFDIERLASRLVAAIGWARNRHDLADLPVGAFGASTGAAAALTAAADPRLSIRAVVSRGGRPDLANEHLGDVTAPTLLIVGGRDTSVIELNRRAYTMLRCEKRLEIVPGATHLFEESGTLQAVAMLASRWFTAHLDGTMPAPVST